MLLTLSHRIGSNRKRSEQSTNAEQKWLETVFSIAICQQMAIENSVSNFFYLCLSIVLTLSSVFIWEENNSLCNASTQKSCDFHPARHKAPKLNANNKLISEQTHQKEVSGKMRTEQLSSTDLDLNRKSVPLKSVMKIHG